MKTSVSTLHHQGMDWLRELEFYKEEMYILSGRLEEIVTKNSSKEVLAQVDHFLNRFILLREQVDVLKHDVSVRNKNVDEIAKAKPTHLNEKSVPVNDELFDRMKTFAKSVADTRYEFNGFLAKNF